VLREGAALISYGACDEAIELFREAGFRVKGESDNPMIIISPDDECRWKLAAVHVRALMFLAGHLAY
jgi:hypothetical protein